MINKERLFIWVQQGVILHFQLYLLIISLVLPLFCLVLIPLHFNKNNKFVMSCDRSVGHFSFQFSIKLRIYWLTVYQLDISNTQDIHMKKIRNVFP
jgi:hypothetical protein